MRHAFTVDDAVKSDASESDDDSSPNSSKVQDKEVRKVHAADGPQTAPAKETFVIEDLVMKDILNKCKPMKFTNFMVQKPIHIFVVGIIIYAFFTALMFGLQLFNQTT